MEDKKKKHHYVWRHYLRAWAQDDRIWNFMKTTGALFLNGLMNVAQIRHYYKLIDLTAEEVSFLKSFIERYSPKQVVDLNLQFLGGFTSITRLKNELANNTDPRLDRDAIAKEIDVQQSNLMENMHGRFEDMGKKFIACRSLDDLKLLGGADHFYEAVMFLSVQYFRTDKMRRQCLSAFAGGVYEQTAERIWNIISIVMATSLAKHLSLNREIRFIFISNPTAVHFITSDQPLFNLLGDVVDENGDTQELDLYYPLSPRHAIRVVMNSAISEKITEIIADEKEVAELNQKMFDNAGLFVFADSEQALRDVIN